MIIAAIHKVTDWEASKA